MNPTNNEPKPLGRVMYASDYTSYFETISEQPHKLLPRPVLVLPWDKEGRFALLETLGDVLGHVTIEEYREAILRAIAPDEKGSNR